MAGRSAQLIKVPGERLMDVLAVVVEVLTVDDEVWRAAQAGARREGQVQERCDGSDEYPADHYRPRWSERREK
jgi:hypothetical protein